ncbi:MAG TPA: ribosome biogenesis GTP-binding protein YihA/YsxC [Polyangiales bacterium]|nr:ribosome biogenesis GTP-binding protein YihA/YsxC [Polyangiales bacterium]
MTVPAIKDASFVLSARDVRELPAPTFAEVVFAGKSNVGKSSLLNALCGRRALARVSATPGATRGINLFRVELGDAVLHFVDLPGYGYAQRSKQERKAWGPMIEGYLRERAGIVLSVVIVDVRRGVADEDQQLLEFLDSLGHTSVIVATKLDKLPKAQRKPALAALAKASGRAVSGFSAESGEGGEALRARLLHAAISRTT